MASTKKPKPVGGSAPSPTAADRQLDVFELIVQGADLRSVLDRIVGVARDGLGATPVSIDLIDPQDGRLRTLASSNLPAGYADRIASITDIAGADRVDRGDGQRSAGSRPPHETDSVAAKVRQTSLDLGMADCLSWPIRMTQGDLAGFLTVHGKLGRGRGRRSHMESLARLTRIAIESSRQVQTADRRFATLAATIPGVVYQRLMSPDGDLRYTYISEGARDLFGIEASDILADPEVLFARFGPEYRATFKDRLRAASESLSLWDVEVPIVTPGGEEKWTHAIARPEPQPDGAVLWTGVILDLTRIKKAELALRRAKDEAEQANLAQAELVARLRNADERFSSLAATIPGVVYQRLVTPDGDIRYTYISDGARDLFGVEPAEVVADPETLFRCHGPEYRKTFRRRLLAASRSLTMWDIEAQIVTTDGEEKWTHAIARPHRLPDGSVLWDGVILDATRIKEAGRELQRAKEAAEKSSHAKTQFLASMSHELRTPLNAIIGFSEILNKEVHGPLGNGNYVEYSGYVLKSAHRLLETINSILEFTRFETFEVEINDRTVHAADVIRAAVVQARDLADDANIEILAPLEDGLPILICDQDLVRQMLVHLLSNAMKFTPQDGRVVVTAECLSTGELAVTISDNGIGIAKEDMPKIFEAFSQIEGAFSRRYGGSGLGVPLAVSMAKLHGAELKVESELGRGTTVTVVFPAQRVVGPARRQVVR